MIKENILIVEDDKDFANLVIDILTEENFTVLSVESAEEANKKLAKSKPGLIILDILLPGTDGLEFCKMVKHNNETKHIPIIMLTSKKTETDMVTGLGVGADDYLTKPFRPRELVARVRALLRRIRNREEPEKIIKCGKIKIEIDKRVVYVEEKIIDLTPNEFDLLHSLMKKKGDVLSRNFLMESIWGYEYLERAAL